MPHEEKAENHLLLSEPRTTTPDSWVVLHSSRTQVTRASSEEEGKNELGIGRGRTGVHVMKKGPPYSRSPRILRRPACGIESTAGHSSPLHWALLWEKWSVMGAWPSSLGPLGSSAGGAAHWREVPGLALGLRGHYLPRWGSGVPARPPPEGQPDPQPSFGPKRASAVSLLPSRLGRPEQAPAPVAAVAGGRGERGARAEEAGAARTLTRRSRSRREGRTSGGRGGSAAWRRALGAWTSGAGAGRRDALNQRWPSAPRDGKQEPSAAGGGGRLARGRPGGGG